MTNPVTTSCGHSIQRYRRSCLRPVFQHGIISGPVSIQCDPLTGNRLTYEKDNGATTNERLSDEVYVVYNGTLCENYDFSVFNSQYAIGNFYRGRSMRND